MLKLTKLCGSSTSYHTVKVHFDPPRKMCKIILVLDIKIMVTGYPKEQETSITIEILSAEAIIYYSHLIQAMLIRNFRMIDTLIPYNVYFHSENTAVLSVFTNLRKH